MTAPSLLAGRLDRRALIAGGAAALATPLALAQEQDSAPTLEGLKVAATRIGVRFGSAVNITTLRNDVRYGETLRRECSLLVPENEMKWEYVEPTKGQVTFVGGDEIRNFSTAHRTALKGTTLVWHRGMPSWVFPEITPVKAAKLMRIWIRRIAGRYRGQIESWDTVNEIIDLQSGRPDLLRRTPWLEALGESYIDLAFATLRETDPQAAGIWNEDDVCLGADWMEARRNAVLRHLDNFLRRGVPIRRFGLQSHLNSLIPLDAGALRRFLKRIAEMGLAIEISELDVDDRAFPADAGVRDQGVADLTRRYLDVVLDEPAVVSVITWDIIDSNTWYNDSPRRRPDGLKQRSLPFGPTYARKTMWRAIRAAFNAAPNHSTARALLRGAAV